MRVLLRILWYWWHGVKFISIKGVYIGKNALIMPGATIYPNTYIDGYSFVCEGATILPDARITNSTIFTGSEIGCEVVRSVAGYNTSAKHQGTYIGDAVIGDNCNIGAGAVFCNYDGSQKNITILADEVFVGSGVMLIAPLKLAEKTFIAAGSVVSHDVKKTHGDRGTLVIARGQSHDHMLFDKVLKSEYPKYIHNAIVKDKDGWHIKRRPN